MKTTLVLLPGLNGTSGLFEPLIKCARKYFDVLAISYPTQEKLSYDELTSYVVSELQAIDGTFILVGESFSGPISLFASEKNPAGLLGVVLVSSFVSAPNYRVGRYLPWHVGFLFAEPLYKIRLAMSRKENQSFISSISRELQKVSPQVLGYRIQEIFSLKAETALANCSYPVMYFRGVKDYVVPEKNLKKILKIKPDIRVVVFDTQHFVLQSKPEQAVSELRVFESSCY